MCNDTERSFSAAFPLFVALLAVFSVLIFKTLKAREYQLRAEETEKIVEAIRAGSTDESFEDCEPSCNDALILSVEKFKEITIAKGLSRSTIDIDYSFYNYSEYVEDKVNIRARLDGEYDSEINSNSIRFECGIGEEIDHIDRVLKAVDIMYPE